MSLDRREFLLASGAAALLPPVAAQGAADVVRIPVELTDSRVVVSCSIGGQGPFAMVFDTGGAIGLIQTQLARTLKLKQIGSSMLGLHGGRGAYPIYHAPDLVFGGQVRQPDAAFAGVDIINFGPGLVGSLAAGVLTAVDGELDFEASEWRIYRGQTPNRDGWTRFDRAVTVRGNPNGSPFLFADARLNGATFRFGLDTGMPSTMRIYRKTAEAAGLWHAPRWTPAAPGGKARIVRAPTLELAGTTLTDLLVTMLEEPEWTYFDAGVIGLPLLRHFNMAAVASERVLYLKHNALPAQPERYNRAGVWIEHDGKAVTVGVVGPQSPADHAGLKAGDRLVGADFHTLVERLYEPAGTQVALQVERGGARRDVVLTLADFL